MTTRRNTSSPVCTVSAMVGRLLAHENAEQFQGATPKQQFYPNGYRSLAQRLVLGSGSYSGESYDHKYFCTIQETEHLACTLHAGG